MNVSVIVPAHNSASTLARTLESLREQTHSDWEAIVVDDGATDDTPEIARGFTERDARIRLVRQARAGLAGARNTGIAHSRFEWLVFLDADDWLLPDYLERLSLPLRIDPRVDGAYCGWSRVAADGTIGPDLFCPAVEDLFDLFAQYCALAVHACIVRRELVEAVGVFDTSFTTCEDWDLWQRVTRVGARLVPIRAVLARYALSPHSLSTRAAQVLDDGLRIIERGHAPDPRVAADARHPHGRDRGLLPEARLQFLSWCAGLSLGSGGDPSSLLDRVHGDTAPALNAEDVARNLFRAAPIALGAFGDRWRSLWSERGDALRKFFIELERRSGARALAARAERRLELLVSESSGDDRSFAIGRTQSVRIEIAEPIPDLTVDPGVERARILVECEGEFLGGLTLPACDGRVSAYVLTDAISSELAWTVLGKFFAKTLYPRLSVQEEMQRRCLELPEIGGLEAGPDHDVVGWTIFLQEIWGRPDWLRTRFYDPGRISWALRTYRKAEGRIAVEVSQPVPHLRAAAREVEIVLTVGGIPLGVLAVEAPKKRVTSEELIAAITRVTGMELCRAAVREGILGRSMDGSESLRERLSAACVRNAGQKINRPWTDGPPGLVLGRREERTFGTSCSRRAAVPAETASDLLEMASAAGETVVCGAGSGALYVPELLSSATPSKQAFRAQEPEAPPSLGTERLPILTYHRVAEATSRYSVTPEAFEQQLQYLREQEYRSIGIEEWQRARETRRPISGRAVVLSFDDGYLDFLTCAWPLLRRYDFTALVFLVAAEIGGWNRWDHDSGARADLLTWPQIRKLQREGAQFGSHSFTHPLLSTISPAEIVREAARSRTILERGLEASVRTFAYPHGDEDGLVQHLVGACGYVYGLTCRPGLADFDHPLLALPRIEITGSDGIEDFVAKIRGAKSC